MTAPKEPRITDIFGVPMRAKRDDFANVPTRPVTQARAVWIDPRITRQGETWCHVRIGSSTEQTLQDAGYSTTLMPNGSAYVPEWAYLVACGEPCPDAAKVWALQQGQKDENLANAIRSVIMLSADPKAFRGRTVAEYVMQSWEAADAQTAAPTKTKKEPTP